MDSDQNRIGRISVTSTQSRGGARAQRFFFCVHAPPRLCVDNSNSFGGLRGVRDDNLLLSCVESTKQCVFGQEVCITVYDKAAAYLFNIVWNHPFNDGGKRIKVGSAYLFLKVIPK